MINGKIVRALDVGYGNVKFVKKHESIEVNAYSHLKEPPIFTQKDHLKLSKAATEI